jgi:ABC-type branched-subunit amino acid transport system substrate-binding protein
MRKIIAIAFFILFSAGFAGCGAFVTTTKVKYPNEVQAPWRDEFNQAERDFEAKNYGQAEKAYRDYSKKYPYNELTDKSEFRLGQIAMLRQNYPQAIQIYEALIKKTPDPAMKAKSRVKEGISEYRQRNYGGALSAFGAVEEKYLDDREIAKMANFAIRSSSELKEDLNRRAYYYALLYDVYEPVPDGEIVPRYGEESIPKSEVKPKLKEWVELSTPVETIDRRLQTYRGKYSGPYLDYKLGKSYYESKDNRKAQDLLKRYVSRNPNHDYADQARRILTSIGVLPPTTKGKGIAVGVILPLSGKYEQYGNNTLKGMECAASVKPECHGVSNIRLVVKDSGGDPQRAQQLVEELVTKDKVIAILGPLSSAEVDGAAKEAQARGVTMLALAQKKGVPTLGDNIFRFSLTPSAQVEALLRYITNSKKLKLFAALFPNNNYGQEFVAEFEKALPLFGGKLAAKKGFAPSKADLSDELRELKLSVSQVGPEGKAFDALFVPDSYLTMGRVAPAMAKASLTDVTALGTNAWNDASLPQRIGSYLASAIFVDVYYRDSGQPTVQNFVREFQAAYAYPPSTLEAMGYDAVRILSEAVGGKSVKKEDIKPALLQMKGYQGVTGLKGFRSDREAEVQPFILGVDASGIKELK